MMKKQSLSVKAKHLLLAILFLLSGGGPSYAAEQLDLFPLEIGYNEPVPGIPGHGKGPVYVPAVVQDGHELFFLSSHPVYTLYIVEDDVVVYSVVVSSATTAVLLPSWLSGNYVLYLHPEGSNYYFYGDITL